MQEQKNKRKEKKRRCPCKIILAKPFHFFLVIFRTIFHIL
ncbi:Hypothetical protein Minf_0938 [Methylacidiphilum infernorum V4]|uniref:Uncharacterized protein n=1 Tax=Methylacidiphilum infernorum (isolate V4) TaxID=481448 RepID=B3DUJ0_METI4|nr:Hypothetical protein Minf_0938 [Methylacidiphilum infernorum V4]